MTRNETDLPATDRPAAGLDMTDLHVTDLHVTDLGWLDPAATFARFAGEPGLCLLDSAMEHPTLGRYSYLATDPVATVRVERGRLLWNGEPCAGPPLAALRARLAPFRRPARAGLPPFQGGAAGFFAYEFAGCLERLPAPAVAAPGPQAAFGVYDRVIAWDHVTRETRLVSTGTRARHEALLARLAAPPPPAPPRGNGPDWQAEGTRAGHEAAVRRTIDYVLAGDIFQANIARRFTARLPAAFSPAGYYLELRRANPAPFSACLDFGDVAIASSSPERFLRLDGTRIEARPIKGTMPRSADPAQDAAAAAALAASAKDRAENVMIVDLMRNDLSRVAVPASVRVPVLCGVESYAGLHHLVSAVTADLAPGKDGLDLLAAAFPGGSVTGAPKLRAMEIITELEGHGRGPYCGSIGWIGFDGSFDFNIAIRTVTFTGDTAVFQTGGGITALSDPAAEFDETVTKASRILAAARRPGVQAP